MPRLPWIDALRGIAIAMVFLQHAGDTWRPAWERALQTAWPTGAPWLIACLRHAWWGVDLFFVLSGLSLSLSWLRGARDVRRFFAARVARIYPAYLVALALSACVHPALLWSAWLVPSLFVHLTLLQGYFSPGHLVFVGAAWSLTPEWHFYMLFPWLARAVLEAPFRVGLRRAAWVVAASWVFRTAAHVLVIDAGASPAWLESTQRHWLPSRLDQFVLGMCVALAWAQPFARERAARWTASTRAGMVIALVAALPALFSWEQAAYLLPGGSLVYAPLSLVAALIVGALVLAPPFAPPGWLVALGRQSYGVFLCHQLALELTARVLPSAPVPDTESSALARSALHVAVAFALSWMAGALSFRFVESPAIAAVTRARARLAPSR